MEAQMQSLTKVLLIAILVANSSFAEDDADSALLAKIAATQKANIDRIDSLALACVTKLQTQDARQTIPQLVLWKPKERLFISSDTLPDGSIGRDARKSLSPTELYGGTDGLAKNVWDVFQYASGRWTVKLKEGKTDEYIVSTAVSVNGVRDLFEKKQFIEWHIKKENAYMPHHVVYREGKSLFLSELVCRSTVAYAQIDEIVVPKMLIHRHPQGIEVRTLIVETSVNDTAHHANISSKDQLSHFRLFGHAK